jgi:hypothetical protein
LPAPDQYWFDLVRGTSPAACPGMGRQNSEHRQEPRTHHSRIQILRIHQTGVGIIAASAARRIRGGDSAHFAGRNQRSRGGRPRLPKIPGCQSLGGNSALMLNGKPVRPGAGLDPKVGRSTTARTHSLARMPVTGVTLQPSGAAHLCLFEVSRQREISPSGVSSSGPQARRGTIDKDPASRLRIPEASSLPFPA